MVRAASKVEVVWEVEGLVAHPFGNTQLQVQVTTQSMKVIVLLLYLGQFTMELAPGDKAATSNIAKYPERKVRDLVLARSKRKMWRKKLEFDAIGG